MTIPELTEEEIIFKAIYDQKCKIQEAILSYQVGKFNGNDFIEAIGKIDSL